MEEVEVTPEMVEAGRAALAGFGPSDMAFDAVTAEQAVRAVFVAMVCAQMEGRDTSQ